jgi:D-alanyl-D-alanine carboxypeptidase (penicillin-binding protein 5/6)
LAVRLPLLPVACLGVAAVLAGSAAYGAVKLRSAPPRPVLRLDLPASFTLAPGVAPPVVMPAVGSFDLVSNDEGQLAGLAVDTVLPIGSIAKVMTALVVLTRMPLSANDPGPTYTITAQDVSLYQQTIAEDGSALAVTAGERFTERQMLLGLLLPSANNLAETLGVWVARSQAAFIADLNAEATTLGMTSTTFADGSGYSQETVSTAADLVLLGEAALANPELAALVITPSAVMPDGTTVRNLDSDLGTVPGWLGIKTGSTPEAGGCLLFAATGPTPLGKPAARVVGAILGQATLADALQGAAGAVGSAFAAYDTVFPGTLTPPAVSGAVTTRWGQRTGLQARFLSGSGPVTVPAGTDLRLQRQSLSTSPLHATVKTGTVVGTVTGSLGGITVATWQVVTTGSIRSPSWEWRLTH